MVLYKYRSNSEYTDKIFTDKQVWLSNSKGLNDPFECSIQEIAKEWIEERVQEGIQAHILGFYDAFFFAKRNRFKDSFFWLNEKQANEFISKLKKKKSQEELYLAIRAFIKRQTGSEISDPRDIFLGFDKQLSEVGIFSLSETAENQLMWAHYADESRGIAIGFDVENNSKLSNPHHCLKVNYSDTLPEFSGAGLIAETSIKFDNFLRPITTRKISFSDPTFKLAVSTKPTCWSYEKEWRYLEEKGGAYPLPSKIKEIIFGLRCNPETKEKYKNLVKEFVHYEVSFYDVVKIPNTNRISLIKI